MLKINQVLLTGVLTDKPALSHLPSGTSKTEVTLAGVSVVHGMDRKQFLPLFMLGKSAEQLALLEKGDVVLVEAEVHTSEWGSGTSRRSRVELKVGAFEKVTGAQPLLPTAGSSMLLSGAVNQARVLCRLASEVSLSHLPGGLKVSEARVAVDGTYRKGDVWVPVTHFFDVAAKGELADVLLSAGTGDRVLLEGAIERQVWDNAAGSGKHSKLRFAVHGMTAVRGVKRSPEVQAVRSPDLSEVEGLDAVDLAECMLEGNTDLYEPEPRINHYPH